MGIIHEDEYFLFMAKVTFYLDALRTVLKIPMQPGKSRVVAMKLNSPIARAA
jgi:bifunctional DNase/RNase